MQNNCSNNSQKNSGNRVIAWNLDEAQCLVLHSLLARHENQLMALPVEFVGTWFEALLERKRIMTLPNRR